MSASQESKVGTILVAGFILLPIGFVILLVTVFSGMGRIGVSQGKDFGILLFWPIGALCILIGLFLIGYGFFAGYFHEKNAEKGAGQVVHYEGVRIVATTAYNREQEMIYDEMYYDDPGVKFYVKLQLPDGRIEEFVTRKEVFLCCGDGMPGNAFVNGKWLGGFTAKIGGGG